MSEKKKNKIIIFMIITMCLSSLLASNLNNVEAPSGNYNIAFGEMIYYESSDSLLDYIRWEFECSNSVNIVVYLMTDDDFDTWEDSNFIILSSGKTSDSGKYTIPREDSWVIVFMHSDIMHPFRIASVYIDVHFSLLDLIDDTVDFDDIWKIVLLILKIVIPVIVVLIILRIIYAIVKSFKQKKITKQEIDESEQIIENQQENSKNKINNIVYCSDCGFQNNETAKFCSNCGITLSEGIKNE